MVLRGHVVLIVLDPRNIKIFVLDEADEMLSRGFKDQIYDVFRKLPANIQVILLSATMPKDVLEVTTRFMRDPIKILVKKEELTLEGIKQFYVNVEKEVGLVGGSLWGSTDRCMLNYDESCSSGLNSVIT